MESRGVVLELEPLGWTVHVAPHHPQPSGLHLPVVQAQVVLDVPVQLTHQPVPLLDLLARPDSPPALDLQLVLAHPAEVLDDGGPGPGLGDGDAEVVLLEPALSRVSPVLGVLGLEAGRGAQAQLPRVTGGVDTGQPAVRGGVEGPGPGISIQQFGSQENSPERDVAVLGQL